MRCSGVNRCRVDLGADLERVAPVDEDRRGVGKHDRGPGRAVEAGQPGKPLGRRRQVFVLILVGMGNDEARQAAVREHGAQTVEPLTGRPHCRFLVRFFKHGDFLACRLPQGEAVCSFALQQFYDAMHKSHVWHAFGGVPTSRF